VENTKESEFSEESSEESVESEESEVSGAARDDGGELIFCLPIFEMSTKLQMKELVNVDRS
jgi:hypothetical protein